MWSLLRGTCFVRLAFFFCFDFINIVLDVFLVGTDASQTTDRHERAKTQHLLHDPSRRNP